MTEDVPARLAVHNARGRPSTQRFRPWELMQPGVAVRSQAGPKRPNWNTTKTGLGHAFWHKCFAGLRNASVQRERGLALRSSRRSRLSLEGKPTA